MPYNLFIEHHEKIQPRKIRNGRGKTGVGTGWEDDFTNILSFYMSSDHEALENFCRLILNHEFEKPIAIETQQITSQGRPDIVITLESGSILIIECKVDACLQPDQLQRYLKINSNPENKTYVALFSKRLLEIPGSVLREPRYKRPDKAHHYFWTNLYNVLPRPNGDCIGPELMRSFFLDYMGAIGFAPSSLDQNWSKLFEDRTIDENQKVQKEFGRRLSLLRTWLKERDFKVTSVSHSGIQAIPTSDLLLSLPVPVYFLTVGPQRARKDYMLRFHAAQVNNEVLSVAYVFNVPDSPEFLMSLYKSFPTPLKDSIDNMWWPTKPYPFSKKRIRLQLVSNLNRFIKVQGEIEYRIKTGCVAVMKKFNEIIEGVLK